MSSSGNAGLRLSMSMLLLTALCAGGAVVVPVAVGAGPVARAVVAKVRLERPEALAAGPGGQLYIADVERNQILERVPGGSFKVVAGNGKAGFSGDGGAAAAARLNAPGGMAVGANGILYFADSGNMRIRAISPRGIISTIAGNGRFGWAGTGTPARAARLGWPAALTIGPHGDLYIAARVDARLGELLADLPRSAVQGPLARAVIMRRLRGLRSWCILGVHRRHQSFSVRLVRVPDAQTGSTPFIRDRWRIRRAAAEVWLHFRVTDAGLYEAATQDFCLHEGATPARFLMSELRRPFHVEVQPRLARQLGRVGS